MNETSTVTSSAAIRQVVGPQLARVHALDDLDARVVAKAPVELAVADVERDHPRRAALRAGSR